MGSKDIEQGAVNGALDDIPTFTFRGNELIGFIWSVYAATRISDFIKDMHEFEEYKDPMEDEEAQLELIRGWANELQELPVRDDGTVEFTKKPWIFLYKNDES